MSDDPRDIERLRLENAALREMLEGAEIQIHSEWGVGKREPYDWLPELEERICEQKTGHQPTRQSEREWDYNGRHYHRRETRCALCGALVRQEGITTGERQ